MKLNKNIFQIALPIFIELLFFMLLGTIDTLMLNSYSDQAVGAVVNANSIINLFTVLLTVVGTGMVVVLTKTLGAKQRDKEGAIVGTGLIFNIILGVVISLILFFLGGILLTIMKTESNVLSNAKSYIKIIAFGFIGLGISQSCGAVFRSYGKPLVIMGVAILSNIINVIINFILIFGMFGAPELGTTGAAIGTLCSNLIAAGLALILLYIVLKFNPKNISFSKEQLFNIFQIGIPSAFEFFLFNLSQFIIMIFVNMILLEGEEGLAAISRAYVVMILNYVMLFSLSIANSNQIIAGYYIGEGDYNSAKKFTLRNYKVLVLIVIGIVVVLNIFWRPLIGLLTTDTRIIESLRGVFFVALFYEVGRSSNVMFIAALRTVNDIIFPVVMAIISMYGFGVLFSYLLGVHFGFGVLGIIISQAMDECFRGTFMFFRFKNKDFDLLRRNNAEISSSTNEKMIESN